MVFAVEAEEIQPEGETADLLAELARHIWNRTHREICHEQRLVTQRFDGVLQLFDRLLRRLHRNNRRRGHPVRVLAKSVGAESIEGAAYRPPQILFVDKRNT